MMTRLSEYIDKSSFVCDISNKLDVYNTIIVDSFVSNQCNLHCKHCYFLDYQPISEPLTLDRWCTIISECIDLGIKHFHFSGKEPFCDKRIKQILSLLDSYSEQDLFYGLVTNGSVANIDEVNKLLQSNLSYLEISVEGLRSYNDSIRGKGHFDKIDNLIRNLCDKTKVNLTSTIFENNINELRLLLEYFVDKGVTKFNFSPYIQFVSNKLIPVKEIETSTMLHFFKECLDFLSSISSTTRSVDIRLCLSPNQCFDLFSNENILTNKSIDNVEKGKKIIYREGNHILELSFPLISIPFLTQLVITNDGYIIQCADDIHFKRIHQLSLGNLSSENMLSILSKRRDYILKFINKIN